jgi:hypothetical protein
LPKKTKKRVAPDFPGTGKTLRYIPHKELAVPMFHAPPGAPASVPCEKCGTPLVIRWSEPFPQEVAPYVDWSDPQRPIFLGNPLMHLGCRCGHVTDFSFVVPNSPTEGFIPLFGDESYHRNEHNELFFSYSLFGCDDPTHYELYKFLRDFKLACCPDVDPDTWPFHTYDLRNMKWRDKNEVPITIEEINVRMVELAALIKRCSNNRIIFVSTIGYYDVSEKETRDRIIDVSVASIIFVATDAMTRRRFGTKFFLESSKKPKSPQFMDDRIEKIGRKLCLQPSYLYVRRGRQVDLPTTCNKMFAPSVQIADFIAYWVNNYIDRSRQGQDSLIKPEDFGPIIWAFGYNSSGWRTRISVGMPFTIPRPVTRSSE